MSLLRITNLKKSYFITRTQKQEVLKGVNIEFKSGDLVALLGESGCGKSTLINILGGLDMDYTGSIVIKGDYIRDFSQAQMDDYRKKRVGLIFQNYNLIGHANILENVELAMSISDIDEKVRKERALDLLKMVGLGKYPNKYPSQLSGGQRQRVAIARALANNPTIILADEPTGALDKDSAEVVLKILRKIAESGKLVIIVTHSQKVADECGRVIKLDNGVIVEDKVINKLHIDSKRDKEIVPKNMKKKDVFNQAFQNVLRNKGRSILMSIGMAVGITAMMLILCLSGGLTSYVNNVYSSKLSSLELMVSNSSYSQLTDDDIEDISNISGIESTSKTTLLDDASYTFSGSSGDTQVLPVIENYVPSVLYGSLPQNSGEVMIGVNMASALSTTIISVVGQSISIAYGGYTHSFSIVGIYDNDSSNVAYILESDINSYSSSGEGIGNILLVTLKDVTYISSAVSDIKALGYTVTQEESSAEEVLEYIDLGTSVLTSVGAISMIVSAIMIFIVLYISVSERIKEIGILRSIGARKKDISRMFIYEAGLLGLLGGIIGVVSCIVLTIAINIVCISTLSYALISYNIWYYLLGILLSTGVSVLAGIAPSMRAANLDPVECLREE
jgi:ABC-type lipoprotein export system ATPase subunit/ABC-type antimicrobial peptide transport system permease subunit